MPQRASALAPATPLQTRADRISATAVNFSDIPAATRLLHELLKEAGLRACRIEHKRNGSGWTVSAIHSGVDGNWVTCQMAVDHHQLIDALEDRDAHRELVSRLAKTLAPCASSVA